MRIVFTVLSLVLFIAIMAWTWARGRREGFDEAARLPFQESGHE